MCKVPKIIYTRATHKNIYTNCFQRLHVPMRTASQSWRHGSNNVDGLTYLQFLCSFWCLCLNGSLWSKAVHRSVRKDAFVMLPQVTATLLDRKYYYCGIRSFTLLDFVGGTFGSWIFDSPTNLPTLGSEQRSVFPALWWRSLLLQWYLAVIDIDIDSQWSVISWVSHNVT